MNKAQGARTAAIRIFELQLAVQFKSSQVKSYSPGGHEGSAQRKAQGLAQ
jgi:hypothetical protein